MKLYPLPQYGERAYTLVNGFEMPLDDLILCQFAQINNDDEDLHTEAIGQIEVEATTNTTKVKIKLNICQICYDKWNDI